MSDEQRKCLLCNCNKTMSLDGKAVARALGLDTVPHVSSELCRRQLGAFESVVKEGGEVVVACTQEAPLFTELHQEMGGAASLKFVNIRETAGWSSEGAKAAPKMAALMALATVPEPEPVAAVSYKSEGRLLIVGPGAAALAWADKLNGRLAVSVLATDTARGPMLPLERQYAVFSGKVIKINGYLGVFNVDWEQLNPIDLEICTRCNACIAACPEQAIDHSYQVDLDRCKAHRKCVKACGAIGAIDFERSERARSDTFDLVLDLSAHPLINLPQPPQGYFAPGYDPLEQGLAVLQLTQLTGEFEKPKFFLYKEKSCAHGRSEITGCTKCIDVCSTRAITGELSEGRVNVESHLCMGCGGCATVCPSGAMTYAYPRVSDMGVRLKTVLHTYRRAGGTQAALLFHNGNDGRELIGRLGRGGRGLPARVIPIEVMHVAALGIDLLLGAIALGATQCFVLAAGSEDPAYVEALEFQAGLAQKILHSLGYGSDRVRIIRSDAISGLEAVLWDVAVPSEIPAAGFNLSNDKRTTLDFAFDHLQQHAAVRKEEVPLPSGAPFGAAIVNRQTCTLCMACVGACPGGALLDSKESPALKFIERNCVQCGLCVKTCPEKAVTLSPRLLLSKAAKTEIVLHEAEPFSCVKCGKPFATKQMVENMVGRLATHSMFAEPKALERLKMCADCRVADLLQNAQHGSISDV